MANSKMAKCQAMESINLKMDRSMKDSFYRTSLMAEENLLINLMIL